MDGWELVGLPRSATDGDQLAPASKLEGKSNEMYATSRSFRVKPGAMPQAINLTNYVIGLLNGNHGGMFGAGIQVGGDPSIIGISGGYETLADYERMMGEMAADAEFQGAVQLAANLMTGEVEDNIWNVRMPLGDPGPFFNITTTDVNLSRIGEAMTFAAEVASTISGITGATVGLSTAVTGRRSRINWAGYNASMAEMEEQSAKLESDESYMDLFKRAEGLVVPNALSQTIWRGIAA